MKRKILAYGILLCLLLTIFPMQSYALEEASSYVLMYDNFAYEISSNWTPFGTLGNGGSGWGSRWAGDKNDFTTACPATPRVTINPKPVSEYVAIKNSATIYRKFGTALSAEQDGEYFFESTLSTTFIARSATEMLWSMGVGSLISVGFEDKGNNTETSLPYITIGPETTYGTTAYPTNGEYTLILRLSISAVGKDTVYLRVIDAADETGADRTDWDIIAETDISADLEYMSYSVPDTKNLDDQGSLRVYNVNISSYPKETIKGYDAFLEKAAEETLSEADCEEGMAHVSELSDCALRSQMISNISREAQNIGVTDIEINKMASSTPENSAHIYVEDLENIVLSYRYKLGESIPTVTIDDGVEEVIEDALVEGRNVTITPETPLTYNKSYTITLDNLTDFTGEIVTDNTISFTTSIVPSINIEDDGEYGEGRTIRWLNYEGITAEATVSINGGESQPFINGSALTERGDYTLTLNAEENEGEQKTETRVYNFKVLEAFAPTTENRRIEGTMATGEYITATYDFFDKNAEDEGESEFQWYSCKTIDGTFSPIANATSKIYQLRPEDEDMYLMFEVTPVADSELNSRGETQKSEPRAGAFKPTATNIKIAGEIALNKELKASFTYNDINGLDKEGVHEYKWYTKDSEGTETPVGEGNTYTIREEDFEKQIFVRIIPKTTQKPYSGTVQDSQMLYTPAKPIAKDVRIEGKAKVGSTLSGYYTYFDVNGDEQADTEGYWINADNDMVIADGHTIKLTSNLEGVKIAYVVKPQSVKAPQDGEPIESTAVTVKASGGDGGFGYSGDNSGSDKESIAEPTKPIVTPPKDSSESKTFQDMAGHWAESSVAELKKLGLINGVSETDFMPQRHVSRAEFVVMMVRLAGLNADGYQGSFDDVIGEDWFSSALQAALENGIISEDVSFRPQAQITRAEAAKIISVLLEKSDYDAGTETKIAFSDEDTIPEWAASYTNDVAKKGVMIGDENGAFNPGFSMTRAEAATIMWRLYQGGVKQ